MYWRYCSCKENELSPVLKPSSSSISEEDSLICIGKGVESGTLIRKLVNSTLEEPNEEV